MSETYATQRCKTEYQNGYHGIKDILIRSMRGGTISDLSDGVLHVLVSYVR